MTSTSLCKRSPLDLQVEAAQLFNDVKERLEDELYAMFLPGEVCVFDMCELLKERYEETLGTQLEPEEDDNSNQADEAAGAAHAAHEGRDQESEDERRMAAAMVTGEPYTERKSTFQV